MINQNGDILRAVNPEVLKSLEEAGPHAIKYDVISVKMNPNQGTLVKYAHALWCEIQSRVFSSQFTLTQEKLTMYFSTLLQRRIDYVNGKRYPDGLYVIPSFLYVVLENVGIARDMGIGVEMKPEFDSNVQVLEPNDFTEVAQILYTFGRMGFEFAEVMPRDKRGSFEYMSMSLLNNEIVCHVGSSHAVYSLLASMTANTMVNTVLGPRVSYGHFEKFEGLVRTLARFK